MSKNMRWLTFCAVGLAALLLGIFLLRNAGTSTDQGDRPSIAREELETSPSLAPIASIVLVYTDGGADGPGALTLRLFSPRARRGSDPIELAFPKGIWHRVQFEVVVAASNLSVLDWKDARPRHFPTARTIRLGPNTTLEAFYRLDAGAVPPPGSRIVATIELEGVEFRSNAIEVGEPPQTARESQQRAARVALRLREFEQVLEISGRMLENDSKDPIGYWLQGLALEGLQKPGPALEAYRACRDAMPPPERLNSGEEIPAGLAFRIKVLEERQPR